MIDESAPATCHNATAALVTMYGQLLAQQDATIRLLKAELARIRAESLAAVVKPAVPENRSEKAANGVRAGT